MQRSRRQEIRSACISLAGELVRAVDLVMEHHVDNGRPLIEEALDVKKQALLLIVEKHLGDDVVVLMESSKLKLPSSLEDTSAHDISCFLEGKPADPHARPGYDDDEDLIRPVRPGE